MNCLDCDKVMSLGAGEVIVAIAFLALVAYLFKLTLGD